MARTLAWEQRYYRDGHLRLELYRPTLQPRLLHVWVPAGPDRAELLLVHRPNVSSHSAMLSDSHRLFHVPQVTNGAVQH